MEFFGLEIADMEPDLVGYLFTLVVQLAEGNRKHYPVKKVRIPFFECLLLPFWSLRILVMLILWLIIQAPCASVEAIVDGVWG